MKILTCIITAIIIMFFLVRSVSAETIEAGSSAVPKFKAVKEEKFDYRVYTLQKFFKKYNSPLSPYSTDFIRLADFYSIDFRIVPSISGVESTFGKRIPPGSYNAYGWANGSYSFKSWPDSINKVSSTLRKEYLDKGVTSIASISRKYAPPSKSWAGNVAYFMKKIDVLPFSFDI